MMIYLHYVCYATKLKLQREVYIGVKSDSYSVMLLPVIMSKLPLELCLFISRNFEEEWNIVVLLEKVGEEILLRE